MCRTHTRTHVHTHTSKQICRDDNFKMRQQQTEVKEVEAGAGGVAISAGQTR